MSGTVLVKNLTAQGREVIFHDGVNPIHYWLQGKTAIRIPQSFLTPLVTEAARRQILAIRKD